MRSPLECGRIRTSSWSLTPRVRRLIPPLMIPQPDLIWLPRRGSMPPGSPIIPRRLKSPVPTTSSSKITSPTGARQISFDVGEDTKDIVFVACANFPVARGYLKRGFARTKHVLSNVEGTPSDGKACHPERQTV